MILEGLVTTLDDAGAVNLAPMGPSVEPDFQRFVLRPFRTSTTYKNLKSRGEGVLHVTDDVLLLARSTIGTARDVPTHAAAVVRGAVLSDCCRYYEFQVADVDEREERPSFHARTVHQGSRRDFFGFNRARHSVLETAILASRMSFLPIVGLGAELEKHRVIVEKTGDRQESEAFFLLLDHIRARALQRGFERGALEP